ncbi:hypothetical protein ACSBR2_016760 [Camellia fascicularis]
MAPRLDLLQRLQFDMLMVVLMSLDDPADLIRASAVSCFWRQFIITHRLCKQLCLRLLPQLSNVVRVSESSCGRKKRKSVGIESSNSAESKALLREHRAYGFLARALKTFTPTDCIAEAVSASSTDNYPEESIRNTLNPRDRVLRRASYWSSKGQKDPAVPETLIYKLISNLCVITEISVQPFQAYFQAGLPIYSAKSFRFRIGYLKSRKDLEKDLKVLPLQLPADDRFIWTYTSQEFRMAQENRLQKFVLPEPVLCVGGFLQVELLGRVQKQETDGLLYICVSHVKVVGRSLFPTFEAEVLKPSGKFVLKYDPEAQNRPPPLSPYCQLAIPDMMHGQDLRDMEQWLYMFGGNDPDFVFLNDIPLDNLEMFFM